MPGPGNNHLDFYRQWRFLSLVFGYYLSSGMPPNILIWIALERVFSVMNTFLMARKVLENWLSGKVINN